ncbi:MAG: glycosyltransferase family 2 protein [Chloroflexi bacterium]|nr:glycosyltransferase family 2 protein [Chloroflexota bacterium]
MSAVLESLSYFVPARDEAGNLPGLINRALEVLPAYTKKLEIIVVDDGSSDNTRAVVSEIERRDPRVRLISHPKPRGYGAALRTGFEASRNEWVFMTDGDGQFDPGEISLLLKYSGDFPVILGKRIKRKDGIQRLFVPWVYHIMLRLLLGLKAKDIDCGFKLIRKDVLDKMKLKSEGGFISAELLYRASQKGIPVMQTGVSHFARRTGKEKGATFPVIMIALKEMFSLAFEKPSPEDDDD